MFHGFYNVTSSVLSQNRNLEVISNNMVNVSTPGYKKDNFSASTFREQLMTSRKTNQSQSTVLGEVTMATVADEVTTNFNQGVLETTDYALDFALTNDGFFQIQTNEGTVYTRNGSFSLDGEGYLSLSGIGRVMGNNGLIQLGTDNISVDSQGNIYNLEKSTYVDKIAVVNFEDYSQLTKNANGTFSSTAGGTETDGGIQWKTVEKSNVETAEELTAMMRGQSNIQSAAQMIKLYDSLMAKVVSEIGRI